MNIVRLTCVILSLGCSSWIFADNTNAHNIGTDTSIESLSPELRTLISKEMIAIQQGMQAIIPAYASGDFKQVAEIANSIENSYILKRSLTAKQKEEIQTKLPKAFLLLDKKFHKDAAMLEHVAVEQHGELVGFYFARLTESCVSCHSSYAQHRFPKLVVESKNHDDRH